jgi:alpha-beta hydrolase superfamily lysophospholipase
MDSSAWIAAGAVLLLLLLLSGCDFQYRMLYYPDPAQPSQAAIAEQGLRTWPGAGEGFRGFVGGMDSARSKGTYIVFHGNGGTAFDRDYYVQAFGKLGYRVILAEYPCYGGRSGELGEAAFVKDARETVALAYGRYGEPIYLLGESLGCGVVSAVAASLSVPLAGMVLITPWDTLQSVAQHHFRIIPVRLFLKDSYDNVANLSSFRGRIAVVGAERDGIIPIRHACRLYATLATPERKMWVVAQAGHNDWLLRVDPSWWREIADFVAGAGGEGAAVPPDGD